MTPNKFRRLALSLPETIESQHMDHPDFRVGKKVFATLGPGGEWGMVKLTPEHQVKLVQEEPDVFEPFKGAWGRRGATKIMLKHAQEASVLSALIAAWRKTAPKSLADHFDDHGF